MAFSAVTFSCIFVISARLEGMLLEAKGAWAEAERAYAVLLETNPNDQVLYLLLHPLLAFRPLILPYYRITPSLPCLAIVFQKWSSKLFLFFSFFTLSNF